MPKLSVDRAFAKAKAHIGKGETNEARALYQAILDAFPANERAKQGLRQLGTGPQTGPSQSDMAELLALYNKGQLAALIAKAKPFVIQFPNMPGLWNLLGAAQLGLKQLPDAEASFTQSITLHPEQASAYNNLGVTFLEQGKFKNAADALSQAIHINPDYAEAYNNKGNALVGQNRQEDALAAYAKAVALKPDYAQAHRNIGNLMQQLNRPGDAIAAYLAAINCNPDYDAAYHSLGSSLSGRVITVYQPHLLPVMSRLLTDKNFVRPETIAEAAISLLKLHPEMRVCLDYPTPYQSYQDLLAVITKLHAIPLLMDLMHVYPIPDQDIEPMLISIRSALLAHNAAIENDADVLAFQDALACQCFINEYIYETTESDSIVIDTMAGTIGDDLQNNQQPQPSRLACLASFAPLHDFDWHIRLAMPAALHRLEKRQIRDKETETALRTAIPTLCDTSDDPVSALVKAQYEDNPYPRWVKQERHLNPIAFGALAADRNLRLCDEFPTSVTTPQILIAGCGTGQQAISAATSIEQSNVLAIDLSFSSLAYAKRQSDEIGIKNIAFMQADILDLGQKEKQYDLVESVGVLHHMSDPMAGWRVIADCLKPGGLMRIGLYSESARIPIVAARQLIQDQGITFTHANMVALRSAIAAGDHPDIAAVMNWYDFYSASELRDLLFHVQEHRFTIPQIKTALHSLGLVFCGFEGKDKQQRFSQANGLSDDLYDLDKWHDFEMAHPDCFADMYSFWCQKPTS